MRRILLSNEGLDRLFHRQRRVEEDVETDYLLIGKLDEFVGCRPADGRLVDGEHARDLRSSERAQKLSRPRFQIA